MPQLMQPSKIKIIPKDGEIEITLNIHITVDGKVIASADNAKVDMVEEKSELMIPDFLSGLKLDFGKKE